MNSNGKVALITGAGSGIGRATALAFLREGYSVVLAGRRGAALEETLGEAEERKPSGQPEGLRPSASIQGASIGGIRERALLVVADVSDPASVRALFEKTKETFGRLDLLFNNAGVGAPAHPAGRPDL